MILVILAISLIAFVQMLGFTGKLRHAVTNAPRLEPLKPEARQAMAEREMLHWRRTSDARAVSRPRQRIPRTSVIIPAYNEQENIVDCAVSVLGSTNLSAASLEVWIVDDQSTDNTLQLAKQLQQTDLRLKVLAGAARPVDRTWTGKNWACAQGVEQATGDFLLFIDADVRLQPGAIETVVQAAEREEVDLLTCSPIVLCKCFAEWLAQPLIISMLISSLDLSAVNDPNSKAAFGIGPFMFFKRSAYEQIGGHQAVAAQVLEDSELARRIKSYGLNLKVVSAPRLSSLRMYRSMLSLWEGWTKNISLLAQRNFLRILALALQMLLGYTVPWLTLILLLSTLLFKPLTGVEFVILGLNLGVICLQYESYRLGRQAYENSTRYWWLGSLGGVFVAMIALASFVKTETGWGWTWRGRALRQS